MWVPNPNLRDRTYQQNWPICPHMARVRKCATFKSMFFSCRLRILYMFLGQKFIASICLTLLLCRLFCTWMENMKLFKLIPRIPKKSFDYAATSTHTCIHIYLKNAYYLVTWFLTSMSATHFTQALALFDHGVMNFERHVVSRLERRG